MLALSSGRLRKVRFVSIIPVMARFAQIVMLRTGRWAGYSRRSQDSPHGLEPSEDSLLFDTSGSARFFNT
jgi:hypothetical protein